MDLANGLAGDLPSLSEILCQLGVNLSISGYCG